MGEIVVGDFRERFVCYLPGAALEASWQAELNALARGEPVAVLRYDPRSAWIVYREHEECFVQQHLSIGGAFRDLLPHTVVTEYGHVISTWVTSATAILRFLGAAPDRDVMRD